MCIRDREKKALQEAEAEHKIPLSQRGKQDEAAEEKPEYDDGYRSILDLSLIHIFCQFYKLCHFSHETLENYWQSCYTITIRETIEV